MKVIADNKPDSKIKSCSSQRRKHLEKKENMLVTTVENTMGKGEIARYEQFLLFPQCFQKTCTVDT